MNSEAIRILFSLLCHVWKIGCFIKMKHVTLHLCRFHSGKTNFNWISFPSARKPDKRFVLCSIGNVPSDFTQVTSRRWCELQGNIFHMLLTAAMLRMSLNVRKNFQMHRNVDLLGNAQRLHNHFLEHLKQSWTGLIQARSRRRSRNFW